MTRPASPNPAARTSPRAAGPQPAPASNPGAGPATRTGCTIEQTPWGEYELGPRDDLTPAAAAAALEAALDDLEGWYGPFDSPETKLADEERELPAGR